MAGRKDSVLPQFSHSPTNKDQLLSGSTLPNHVFYLIALQLQREGEREERRNKDAKRPGHYRRVRKKKRREVILARNCRGKKTDFVLLGDTATTATSYSLKSESNLSCYFFRPYTFIL